MRCFLPCFCAPKLQKHSKQPSANANSTVTVTGGGQSHVAKGAVEAAAIQFQPTQQKTAVEESIDWILAQSQRENEKQSSYDNNNIAEVTSTDELKKKKKKKSIDATEEQQQEIAAREEKKENEEEECSESLFSLSLDSGKPVSVSATENADTTTEVNNSPMQSMRLQHQVQNENTKLLEEEQPNPNKDSSSTELIKKLEENKYEKGKPRYQDCLNDDADNLDQQEYSSESSLFSLSTDYRKRIPPTDEKVENSEVSSSSPMPAAQEREGNNTIIPSVLGKPTTVLLLQKSQKNNNNNNNNKENINNLIMRDDMECILPIISPEPSLKLMSNSNSSKVVRQKMNEREVNTSLSSWLVESETTPKSVTSNEDRPILGALTVEDINKYSSMSTTPSSRRCRRSCSPDETPIIGSVGSYWSHTGQSKSSKFRNSGKDVKTKLEAAFEASVAET